MDWFNRRIDKAAAMMKKQDALSWVLFSVTLGLLAVGTIIKGPTNAQFPENHVAYSLRFWLSCAAAPVCLLNVAFGSMVLRHIRRHESNSLPPHEGSR